MNVFIFEGENKMVLNKRFQQETQHPLLTLEKWRSADDYMKRQVGFCAEWCLDNLCIQNPILFNGVTPILHFPIFSFSCLRG